MSFEIPNSRLAHVWAYILPTAFTLIGLTSCSTSQPEPSVQQGLIDKVNKKHSLADDLDQPGAKELTALNLSLKQIVQRAIDDRRNFVTVRNDVQVFEEIKEGLNLLGTKDAERITNLQLINFPITDKMLEPLVGKSLRELDLRTSRVVDLHALRGMTSLQSLRVSETSLNDDGMKVIASLLGLQSLYLDHTVIDDSSLKDLYALRNLRALSLTNCPKLSQAAIQSLRKALPLCVIASGNGESSKEGRMLARANDLFKDGWYRECDALVRRRLSQIRTSKGNTKETNSLLSAYHNLLARCLQREGNLTEAAKEYKHSTEIPEHE